MERRFVLIQKKTQETKLIGLFTRFDSPDLFVIRSTPISAEAWDTSQAVAISSILPMGVNGAYPVVNATSKTGWTVMLTALFGNASTVPYFAQFFSYDGTAVAANALPSSLISTTNPNTTSFFASYTAPNWGQYVASSGGIQETTATFDSNGIVAFQYVPGFTGDPPSYYGLPSLPSSWITFFTVPIISNTEQTKSFRADGVLRVYPDDDFASIGDGLDLGNFAVSTGNGLAHHFTGDTIRLITQNFISGRNTYDSLVARLTGTHFELVETKERFYRFPSVPSGWSLIDLKIDPY